MRKPVPRATSLEVGGAPGNIAAGPLLTGLVARMATTAARASSTMRTKEPGPAE
jgi:hypothetical protein